MKDKNKGIALITGASRGIGAAIANNLADAGYDIWLNYLNNHDRARAVADSIRGKGRSCTLLPFDVGVKKDVDDILAPHLRSNVPEVLVNNAGIIRDALMMWMKEDEWQSVIDTTLLGFFHVTMRILPGMIRRRSGRIINIASTAGQSGLPGQSNYAAAKGGLIAATGALAREVAKKGILVNCVAPGLIDTELSQDAKKSNMLPDIPIGRPGKAEEVASVVRFLCSRGSSYIVGQTISVNGGVYF